MSINYKDPLTNNDFDYLHDTDHKFSTSFDRELHAKLGKYLPLSPASIRIAYFDWLIHLHNLPGKRLSLMESAVQKNIDLLEYALSTTCGIKTEYCSNPKANDKRFEDSGWTKWPYTIYKQAFLLNEEWWQ